MRNPFPPELATVHGSFSEIIICAFTHTYIYMYIIEFLLFYKNKLLAGAVLEYTSPLTRGLGPHP